jgi:hypothetical protein
VKSVDSRNLKNSDPLESISKPGNPLRIVDSMHLVIIDWPLIPLIAKTCSSECLLFAVSGLLISSFRIVPPPLSELLLLPLSELLFDPHSLKCQTVLVIIPDPLLSQNY